MSKSYMETFVQRKAHSSSPSPSTSTSPETVRGTTDRQSYVTYLEMQLERITQSCLRSEQYASRVDQLQSQVNTCEDKVLNLTKLVKLTQTLGDEREAEAQNDLRAVKQRCKRLEASHAQATADIDLLKGQQAEAQDELSAALASTVELRVALDCEGKRTGVAEAALEALRGDADRALGQCRELRGDADRALTECRELRGDTDRALAECQELRGDTDRALSGLERALGGVERAFGQCQALRGDTDRLVAECQELRAAAAAARTEFERRLQEGLEMHERRVSERLREHSEQLLAGMKTLTETLSSSEAEAERQAGAARAELTAARKELGCKLDAGLNAVREQVDALTARVAAQGDACSRAQEDARAAGERARDAAARAREDACAAAERACETAARATLERARAVTQEAVDTSVRVTLERARAAAQECVDTAANTTLERARAVAQDCADAATRTTLERARGAAQDSVDAAVRTTLEQSRAATQECVDRAARATLESARAAAQESVDAAARTTLEQSRAATQECVDRAARATLESARAAAQDCVDAAARGLLERSRAAAQECVDTAARATLEQASAAAQQVVAKTTRVTLDSARSATHEFVEEAGVVQLRADLRALQASVEARLQTLQAQPAEVAAALAAGRREVQEIAAAAREEGTRQRRMLTEAAELEADRAAQSESRVEAMTGALGVRVGRLEDTCKGVDGRLEAHAGRLCEGVRLELQGKLEQALSDQTQRFASRLEEHSEVLVSTLQSSVTKVREEVQGMVAGAVAKEVAAGAAPGEKSPGRPLAALETELLAALEDRIADTLTAQQRAVQQVRQQCDGVMEQVRQQLSGVRDEAKKDWQLVTEESALLSEKLGEKAKVNADNIVKAHEQLQAISTSTSARIEKLTASHSAFKEDFSRMVGDQLQKIIERMSALEQRQSQHVAEQATTSELHVSSLKSSYRRLEEHFQSLEKTVASGGPRSDTQALAAQIEQLSTRVVAFEEEYHKSHVSVSEYLQTCRHHMAAQTQKGEETCVAMKQLMDVQETAKMVMLTELEGVKTWAARNLARLKKRLEVQEEEMKAVQAGQHKLKKHVHINNKNGQKQTQVLSDLLIQKAEEADLLNTIVDQEIQEITAQNAAAQQLYIAGLRDNPLLSRPAPLRGARPSALQPPPAARGPEPRGPGPAPAPPGGDPPGATAVPELHAAAGPASRDPVPAAAGPPGSSGGSVSGTAASDSPSSGSAAAAALQSTLLLQPRAGPHPLDQELAVLRWRQSASPQPTGTAAPRERRRTRSNPPRQARPPRDDPAAAGSPRRGAASEEGAPSAASSSPSLTPPAPAAAALQAVAQATQACLAAAGAGAGPAVFNASYQRRKERIETLYRDLATLQEDQGGSFVDAGPGTPGPRAALE